MSSAGLSCSPQERVALDVNAIKTADLSTAAPKYERCTCRPFGLADAMIASAAVAAGLALAREIAEHIIEASGRSEHYAKAVRYLDRALTWGFPVLACLTLGWLLIRFRRPRPLLAVMARQPGTAAALAVGMMLVPPVLAAVIIAAWGNPHLWVTQLVLVWPRVGPAVAVVWLALFVTGRRRPERGWIDGFGRVLGVVWIGTVLLKAPIGPWYLPDPGTLSSVSYEDFTFFEPSTLPGFRPPVANAPSPSSPSAVVPMQRRVSGTRNDD